MYPGCPLMTTDRPVISNEMLQKQIVTLKTDDIAIGIFYSFGTFTYGASGDRPNMGYSKLTAGLEFCSCGHSDSL